MSPIPTAADLIMEHGITCGKIVCGCCKKPNMFACEVDPGPDGQDQLYLCSRCDTIPGQMRVF